MEHPECVGEGGPRWGHRLKVLEEPQKVPSYCSPVPVLSLMLTYLLGDGGDKGGCLDPPVTGDGPAPSTLCQQVPEWTKCTSREKRKEKVEKPFYSDSEGESGPTESADSGEDLME